MKAVDTLPLVTVYGYGPAFGFPDLSPFVLKVLYYAKARGFPLRTEVASPRKSPRGKLPFIEVNGRMICDSREIIDHLESFHAEPMNHWLTPDQLASIRPLQSMLEEHLYFITLVGRWVYDDGFEVLKPELCAYLKRTGIPSFLLSPVSKLIRKSVVKQANAQGAGRLTREVHRDVVMEIFTALDHALGDKPFMMGDRPCTLDCTVGAFTTLSLIEDFQHETAKAFRQFPRLVAYARRSHERYLAIN